MPMLDDEGVANPIGFRKDQCIVQKDYKFLKLMSFILFLTNTIIIAYSYQVITMCEDLY